MVIAMVGAVITPSTSANPSAGMDPVLWRFMCDKVFANILTQSKEWTSQRRTKMFDNVAFPAQEDPFRVELSLDEPKSMAIVIRNTASKKQWECQVWKTTNDVSHTIIPSLQKALATAGTTLASPECTVDLLPSDKAKCNLQLQLTTPRTEVVFEMTPMRSVVADRLQQLRSGVDALCNEYVLQWRVQAATKRMPLATTGQVQLPGGSLKCDKGPRSRRRLSLYMLAGVSLLCSFGGGVALGLAIAPEKGAPPVGVRVTMTSGDGQSGYSVELTSKDVQSLSTGQKCLGSLESTERLAPAE
ncbi:hypothetical protein H257_12833 [Aphanomyces astaci]|uniref:Uncharacterized protein n=1 Tax=Aphanomyces astaci TaxID=112090 RepID=W4FWX9_APHAT|nr:hypothetical protein H257_12833 [Aphanomyces astaci]ETV72030.1 hypothetical protein H257_12833 [Aphanomyces astaci]|eukprot:XP_009838473.1 hypothetical protein H257_12833 [Aphanomyces astaci]